MSTLDKDFLSAIQYQVIEPPDGGAGWPSGLWVRDEVVGLTNQRQNRMLKESLLIVSISTPPTPVAISQHRVALPIDWIRTVGVLWTGSDGVVRDLGRADAFEADHLIPSWDLTNVQTPYIYMEDDAPATLEVQIAPAPAITGTLTYVYVAQGAEIAGDGQNLTFPDEFEHGLRYGVLSDMLSKDGRARDTARATYAAQRFELCVEAARLILKGWS